MRRAVIDAAASILALAVSFAENQRRELVVLPGDFVAAHIADGSNWTTTFVLVNLGN